MKATFTDSEKELIKGKIRTIARKHSVSHTYVNMIMNEDRPITTELSLKIFDDLKATVRLFKPVSQSA